LEIGSVRRGPAWFPPWTIQVRFELSVLTYSVDIQKELEKTKKMSSEMAACLSELAKNKESVEWAGGQIGGEATDHAAGARGASFFLLQLVALGIFSG
jgi:hypothetical protein